MYISLDPVYLLVYDFGQKNTNIDIYQYVPGVFSFGTTLVMICNDFVRIRKSLIIRNKI